MEANKKAEMVSFDLLSTTDIAKVLYLLELLQDGKIDLVDEGDAVVLMHWMVLKQKFDCTIRVYVVVMGIDLFHAE